MTTFGKLMVETVLMASRMAGHEIDNNFDSDAEHFYAIVFEIASKAAVVFDQEETGGWDGALKVVKEELKRLYGPKKTYYVTFKIDGRYTVKVDASNMEEAKEVAETIFETGNLNEMEMIESKPVTVEDENDIVWEEF